MKKSALFSLILLVTCIISTVKAKAQTYEVGNNIISAGLGLGSAIGNGYTYASQSPGFSVQYERGIWEVGPGVISLGGYLGFKSYSNSGSEGGYNYDYKWNYTILGARGAYHFTGIPVENLDVYAGLMLSFNNLSYSGSTNIPGGLPGSYNSDIELSPFVGAKYYFAGNLGGFAELGYGVAFLNIGLSYKF
jgi:hypothetical protein